MIGDINENTTVSAYLPSLEVIALTKNVQDDYGKGSDILSRPWVELNDRSVIDDENRGQMMFNAFVDTSVEDPNEAWKWRGTRSMARNKGVAMHAQVMQNYLLPMYVAQNDSDDIDMDFSEVMRDVIEWMASPTVSNYQSSYSQVGFGMLANPVTYMGFDFFEIYQTIKEKKGNSYETKEVLDEVLSGFKCPIYSSSQVLITNAYERNMQKQRVVIERRWVEMSEMEAKYEEHDNWQYVQKGIKSIYNDEDGLFYDIKDDEHPGLVAEEIWKNRREDSEITFVNGIYLGDTDVENNPIRHRDNFGAPKYNKVPFGYSRIGEHFFYYKSMMNVMGWDNMLYDAMSEVFMNRAMLEAEPPQVFSGSDRPDSSVMFPNAIVAFEDKDAKATPLLQNSNLSGLLNAIKETEASMERESLSSTISGELPEASQKAYSVAQARADSKKLLGDVAKSLGESVLLCGDLMKDIAINKITVPEVDELTGGAMKLKYRTFLLENKSSGGKMMPRTIKFDESLIGLEMTEEEKTTRELKMLEESGYPKNKTSLRLVNPVLFSKFKYLSKVDLEEMFVKNAEYWQGLLPTLYPLLMNNPYTDFETFTRKFLYAYFQSDSEDLIKKQPVQQPQQPNLNNKAVEEKAPSMAGNEIL